MGAQTGSAEAFSDPFSFFQNPNRMKIGPGYFLGFRGFSFPTAAGYPTVMGNILTSEFALAAVITGVCHLEISLFI